MLVVLCKLRRLLLLFFCFVLTTGEMATCRSCTNDAKSYCATCRSVHYCGRDCQKEDFARHKEECLVIFVNKCKEDLFDCASWDPTLHTGKYRELGFNMTTMTQGEVSTEAFIDMTRECRELVAKVNFPSLDTFKLWSQKAMQKATEEHIWVKNKKEIRSIYTLAVKLFYCLITDMGLTEIVKTVGREADKKGGMDFMRILYESLARCLAEMQGTTEDENLYNKHHRIYTFFTKTIEREWHGIGSWLE